MSPRISVIIPALDELGAIGEAIDRARASRPWEIIVVDGGSRDGSVATARLHGARVETSAPGRGPQMNRGAALATGDVLLFLHADTWLPVGFDEHVSAVLATPGVVAGAFRLRIDAPHRVLRLVERVVNWRSRRLGLPYGDQALFMKAEAFRGLGGFPDTAVMEDFELVRRLRRRGRIEITGVPVITSARRWLACGVWRTTLLNQACILAWLVGVSGDRIAGWRGVGPRPGPGARGQPSRVRQRRAATGLSH